MRILGIDPGLQITGYGVIDYKPTRPSLIDAGIIRLKTKTPIPDRLFELERELESIFEASTNLKIYARRRAALFRTTPTQEPRSSWAALARA